jgi:hypothetical protein
MGLYPKKDEKSVFRGMVIPTLRQLGLILGRDNAIRLSANGMLIVVAQDRNNQEMMRVSRVVVDEIDRDKFSFLQILRRYTPGHGIAEDEFVHNVGSAYRNAGHAPIRERVRRWLRLLVDVGLVMEKDGMFARHENSINAVRSEVGRADDIKVFERGFLSAYRSAAERFRGAVVDIAAVREIASVTLYQRHDIVVTEGHFDEMLRKLLPASHDYVVSMGRPGSWKVKSFLYKTNFYRTIAITSSGA